MHLLVLSLRRAASLVICNGPHRGFYEAYGLTPAILSLIRYKAVQPVM